MAVGALGTIALARARRKECVLSGMLVFWEPLGMGPRHLREALGVTDGAGPSGGREGGG